MPEYINNHDTVAREDRSALRHMAVCSIIFNFRKGTWQTLPRRKATATITLT